MKGLSHVAMGQFYEGIKAQTKVMLNDPLLGQKASSEYLKVKYLRGQWPRAYTQKRIQKHWSSTDNNEKNAAEKLPLDSQQHVWSTDQVFQQKVEESRVEKEGWRVVRT